MFPDFFRIFHFFKILNFDLAYFSVSIFPDFFRISSGFLPDFFLFNFSFIFHSFLTFFLFIQVLIFVPVLHFMFKIPIKNKNISFWILEHMFAIKQALKPYKYTLNTKFVEYSTLTVRQ